MEPGTTRKYFRNLLRAIFYSSLIAVIGFSFNRQSIIVDNDAKSQGRLRVYGLCETELMTYHSEQPDCPKSIGLSFTVDRIVFKQYGK